MIRSPFARNLQVDLVPGVEVVKTDGFIVEGEELDAAVVHGEFERIWRLRRRRRRTALKLQLVKQGRHIMAAVASLLNSDLLTVKLAG